MYELKIPKERVACLIGTKGETKRLIERSTKTKLKVSTEGDVEIMDEGLEGYICEKVVKAIGRGFNPNIALNLMQEDYDLIVADIRDFAGKSKNNLMRVKARLIGSDGKARAVIERLTRCDICIYGKTVSIIGEFENLNVAFNGLKKLLSGSPHGHVYGYLEREMKAL